MDGIQELKEDRGEPGALRAVQDVATVHEAIPIGKPLLLDEHSEALKCTVIGVQADLGKTRNLTPAEKSISSSCWE